MFELILISLLCSFFITFFIYIDDNLKNDFETIDINKYIKYFIIIGLCNIVFIFIYNLITNTNFENLNVNANLPDF